MVLTVSAMVPDIWSSRIMIYRVAGAQAQMLPVSFFHTGSTRQTICLLWSCVLSRKAFTPAGVLSWKKVNHP